MKAPTPKREFTTKQPLLKPVYDVRVTINLRNVGISTVYIVFVPIQGRDCLSIFKDMN